MTDTTRRREHGFALLIVLWTLVLLSLIVTAVIALSHDTAQEESSEARLAWARAQADSAIQTAMFHLLGGGPDHWLPDGNWHTLSEPDLKARVKAVIEKDALNPNTAPPALLENVFLTLGMAAPEATSLAGWIVTWRQPLSAGALARARSTTGAPGGCMAPRRPFRSIDDLAVVPGMTPALLARLVPHLSFTQTRAIGPDTADPLLRVAVARLRAAPAGKPVSATTGTADVADSDDETDEAASFIIDAEAPTTPGHMLRRHAVILTQPDHMPPFRMITIRSEDSSEAPP